MKKALFITSFNDPASAAISLPQFGTMANGCDLILSDQSDDHACIQQYQNLCQMHGFRYISNLNKGASEAKRRLVEIALREGYEFIHQISEDFELVPMGEENPAAPNGRASLLRDAETLLFTNPSISFVHWTWFRNEHHKGYFWNRYREAAVHFNHRPHLSLAYFTGEVSLFNWPYSGRVSDIAAIHKKASAITPLDESHKRDNQASNGEWAQAFVSCGHGAVFYAHPVRHRDRIKPEGSLP